MGAIFSPACFFSTLCLDENNLAPSDNQEQKGNNSTALGAGIGVSVAVILIVVIVVVFILLRRQRQKQKYGTPTLLSFSNMMHTCI